MRSLICASALAFVAHAATAQSSRIVGETLHSASLANLLGAPAETHVTVYLPPSYGSSPGRRYPVLYLLHGFGSSDAEWTGLPPERKLDVRNVPGLMDSLIAAGAVKEMIIVMPSALNPLGGTYYVNSVTTGQWETFMTRDLVDHMDSTYRTLAKAESRGIAGVSMGGYGTFYLSMRHGGDIYGAMYAMSPCCSVPLTLDSATTAYGWNAIASSASFDALRRAETQTFQGLVLSLIVALSAAFSPDANKPPFFFDALEEPGNGGLHVNQAVAARWNEHFPRVMLATSVEKLRRMNAIHFEIGAQDRLVPPADVMGMDSAFTRAGIPHTFELFQGTHGGRVTERLGTRLLPFFSRNLVFAP